jgi:peptide/nickel transport system permease protein
VLWITATLTFAATFLSPIDPARAYAGPYAAQSVVRQLRRQFGLDRPIYVQYWRYLQRITHGNLGSSLATGEPVTSTITSRLPKTAILAAAATALGVVLGVALGLAAAFNRQTLLDRCILALSLVGVATPSFVLGFILLYFLAFREGWFPIGGSGSFSSLVLPALTIGVPAAAWYARILRSSVLNILGEDYVRAARARGLSQRVVTWRHVFRNALGPLIAMVGLDMGKLLGGVLVVEQVFAWPGVGQLAWQAVSFNDIPVVIGTVLVAAAFIVVFNFVADVLIALADPRVRY